MSIPLYMPRLNENGNNGLTILAGDVGGTKTNLGIFVAENNKMRLLKEAAYSSANFNSATEIVKRFLYETSQPMPDRICLGAAGPVLNGEVEITALKWSINANELLRNTNTKEVALLNDVHANAYGLAGLTENDYVTISEGKKMEEGNMAIIAPGTGLGEACLFWDGDSYRPFSTEGGHCDFAQQSENDIKLYRMLRKKYEHVSWELVASGSAIHDLYIFLRDEMKMEEPAWLAEKLKTGNASSIISEAALQNGCEICDATMKLFVKNIARESCNLVLKMKAVRGLFLSGGIPPKILKYFTSGYFFECFRKCDRMGELVESVPVKIILNDKTPLLGAAYYGAFGPMSKN
jgi:glucokinase